MGRCRFVMLTGLRAASSTRAWLFAGALFAVIGSFGLHPEPLSEQRTAPGGIVWTSASESDSASHGCMACLAHRSVSLSGLAVFVPAADLSHAPAPAPPVQPCRPSAASTEDGRAPPVSV